MTSSDRTVSKGEPPMPPQTGDDEAGFGGIAWADADAAEAATVSSADGDVEDPVPDDQPDAAAVTESEVPPTGKPNDQEPSGPAGDDDGEPQGSDGARGQGPADPAGAGDGPPISVEDLVVDLERVSAERDQYLDASRRLQAEFENYKKAVAKREVDARERANETLVSEILPVLDACDGALASGATDVEPVRNALMGALTKQGLERLDGQDEAFDPELHDAVMHEPSDDAEGPVVAEVMRAGYRWKGRVIRPAMVRVRG